jgi:hypothetical protein
MDEAYFANGLCLALIMRCLPPAAIVVLRDAAAPPHIPSK